VFETSPSGVFYEYKAQAMGARSQSARTYLEKNFESFEGLSKDELIRHALLALKGTAVKRLTSKNVTVAFVGKDVPFACFEDDDVRPFLEGVVVEGEEVDAKDELDESHMS